MATVCRKWPLFEIQLLRNASPGDDVGGSGPTMVIHLRISLLITDGFGEEVLRRDLSASASNRLTFALH